VIGLAIGLRTIAWLRTSAIFDDGPLFIYIARAMGEGDWSSALLHPYHPLYSFTALLAGFPLGDLERGAVFVSILAGSLSVLALHLFLRSAFDSRTGLIGAAILAVHPSAVAFSSDVQSDGLYIALFLSAIALLWRSLCTPRVGLAAATGAVAGLAYLTRPEGLGVALAGAGMALVLLIWRRWRPAAAAIWIAALGVGLLLAMAPYLGSLRVESGQWALTTKKSATAMMGFEIEEAAPASRALPSGTLETLAALPRASDAPRAAPESSWGRLAIAAIEVWGAAAASFRFELLPFLLVGLWVCRGRPGLRGLLIGSVAALYGLVLLALALEAGYVSRRHALPPLLLWWRRWLCRGIFGSGGPSGWPSAGRPSGCAARTGHPGRWRPGVLASHTTRGSPMCRCPRIRRRGCSATSRVAERAT
jgi:4-amino-4-deoxy-L-arabinose transferase-like glycosyltransferase